jgi:hypothetical protein
MLFRSKVLALAGAIVLTACQSAEIKVSMASSPTGPSSGTGASDTSAPNEAASSMLAPLVERRETLVATGYAVISVQNHRTPAQQRLLAIRASKLDAYRTLTEQVYGQYLDSTTTVADATVVSDSFRTRVEGVIYSAVLVSINPVGDDTYETTLSLDKAVVQDLRRLYLGQLAQRQSVRR